jgi:hypothetical protein
LWAGGTEKNSVEDEKLDADVQCQDLLRIGRNFYDGAPKSTTTIITIYNSCQ